MMNYKLGNHLMMLHFLELIAMKLNCPIVMENIDLYPISLPGAPCQPCVQLLL